MKVKVLQVNKESILQIIIHDKIFSKRVWTKKEIRTKNKGTCINIIDETFDRDSGCRLTEVSVIDNG